jgi:zinc/manganese transport system substrate-binding protein/manganese/iron transport system substrate-binding protein
VLITKLAIPALLVGASLTLAGCAGTGVTTGTGATGGTSDGTLNVVATTTQVADFTRNIVGDASGVKLTQLIKPNQSAHSFDPSVADLAALGSADVLVINGVGLEEWLDDAISASGFHGVTIDSDEGIEIGSDAAANDAAHGDATGEETHDATHDDATHDDATHDDASADSDHDATHDETHDHAGGNPHIWTSVANAEKMVGTIADGLAQADAAHADEFEANATAYTAQLTALDSWIHTNIDAVPASERLLVSNHDAFGYFTAAYGITYVGSVMPSFDDNAEPSAAAIDELVALIKKTGVKAVFSEASINPKAADTIAGEAHVAVYSGDDALYGDSLGPVGSDGATYITSQLHNVRLILESWGVTPSAVPAELG